VADKSLQVAPPSRVTQRFAAGVPPERCVDDVILGWIDHDAGAVALRREAHARGVPERTVINGESPPPATPGRGWAAIGKAYVPSQARRTRITTAISAQTLGLCSPRRCTDQRRDRAAANGVVAGMSAVGTR
jgi:hypothetical protein